MQKEIFRFLEHEHEKSLYIFGQAKGEYLILGKDEEENEFWVHYVNREKNINSCHLLKKEIDLSLLFNEFKNMVQDDTTNS